MGTRYINLVVAVEPRRVIGFLGYFRHTAYVAPHTEANATVCVICPDDRDIDSADPRPLAAELSEKLTCPAVVIWCDDSDQFGYELWEDGHQMDEFVSPQQGGDDDDDELKPRRVAPDEWTPEWDQTHRSGEVWDNGDVADDETGSAAAAVAGDAAELCRAFRRPERVADVKAVLASTPDSGHPFYDAAHYGHQLAELLGWPEGSSESFSGLADERNQGDDEAMAWAPTGNAE